MIHTHDMISEHAFVMGGRESRRGTNYPSLRSQPYILQWEELEKARGLASRHKCFDVPAFISRFILS